MITKCVQRPVDNEVKALLPMGIACVGHHDIGCAIAGNHREVAGDSIPPTIISAHPRQMVPAHNNVLVVQLSEAIGQ